MLRGSLFTAAIALLAFLTTAATSPAQYEPTYPNVADISHASPALVKNMRGYFTAKSRYDAEAWLAHFNVDRITYIDATLGFSYNSTNFVTATKETINMWRPGGKSYPLRILGDLNSAVVFFRDTPELFGDDLTGFGVIDLYDGKVIRQIDYSDGRRVPLVDHRVPDDQFPTNFGESAITQPRNAVIQHLTQTLNAALSAGNGSAAATLFTPEAVFEDLTTRTRIQGQAAIQRYLSRALHGLPYGIGATLRHVVGSEMGGGFEWIGAAGAISARGVNVVELDDKHMITRFTALWDASRASDASMLALTALAIEP